MGYRGYRPHGPWAMGAQGVWVQGVWAMGYRGMGHMGNEAHWGYRVQVYGAHGQ